MDTEQKLNILTESSRFDLACACKVAEEPGRVRGPQGRWIYPVALPSGRNVFLLKTLQSNACINDCSYCPFNSRRDLPRCTLEPEQLAGTFTQLLAAGRVSGLFLSSGVIGSADRTMGRMIETVEILRRRHQFHGYIHLKIIPGASDGAIEQAVRLASRVSVNIEAPNERRLSQLSRRKRFYEDIIATMEKIKAYRDESRGKVSQTTQFVVGAARESDREIVLATYRLYKRFAMDRVYFSAYQEPEIFESGIIARGVKGRVPGTVPFGQRGRDLLFDNMGGRGDRSQNTCFVREHRLYQVDFLLRKYKFDLEDICFDSGGNLSLEIDPKLLWARRHGEFFPVDVNRADYEQLLRVPGIGPLGAKRILKARRQRQLRRYEDLRSLGVRCGACKGYVAFKGSGVVVSSGVIGGK